MWFYMCNEAITFYWPVRTLLVLSVYNGDAGRGALELTTGFLSSARFEKRHSVLPRRLFPGPRVADRTPCGGLYDPTCATFGFQAFWAQRAPLYHKFGHHMMDVASWRQVFSQDYAGRILRKVLNRGRYLLHTTRLTALESQATAPSPCWKGSIWSIYFTLLVFVCCRF